LSWTYLLLLVLLHIGLLAGIVAVVLGLGGLFILLGLALTVAWIGHFSTFSLTHWFILLALVLLAELGELLLGVFLARRFGASRWGMIGALLGGVVGAGIGTELFPVVGTLAGALVGSLLGAVAGELLAGRNAEEGVRAGCGAFLGRALAGAIKLGLGLVIAFLTLRAAYQLG
jgi:uncharacterized protein